MIRHNFSLETPTKNQLV